MENVCYIKLTKGKEAKVSPEDYEYLSQFKWYQGKNGYAACGVYDGGKTTQVYMHREIAKRMFIVKDKCITDHIDRDKLNNTRSNLRSVSYERNNQNIGIRSTNKSGFKGVSFHKKGNKWIAQITIKSSNKYLGLYNTPEEAAKVYDEAALLYYGEYAWLNFPKESRNI